jgi:hypothetical protein
LEVPVLVVDKAIATFRSPSTIPVVLLSLLGLVVGVATAWSSDPVAVGIGGLIIAFSLFFLWRSAKARIVVCDNALLYFGLTRTRAVTYLEIEQCVVEVVDSKIIYEVWAPVLKMRDGSETVLIALARAGFSRKAPKQLPVIQQQIERAIHAGERNQSGE